MRALRRLRIGLAAAAVGAAAGCFVPPRGPHNATLTISPPPYVPDIPLADGFDLVEKSCEDWSAGPIRYLRHRYRGWADKDAIRRF